MIVCSIVVCLNVQVFAGSYSVSGTLNYRLLNGSANGKCYSIGKGKSITFSGKVNCTGFTESEVEKNAYGEKVGVQTTYVNLYEKNNSGVGTKICGDTVKVSSGTKTFSASGTSKYANSKYVYIYKPMNDGYDLKITGTISF